MFLKVEYILNFSSVVRFTPDHNPQADSCIGPFNPPVAIEMSYPIPKRIVDVGMALVVNAASGALTSPLSEHVKLNASG
jgi:hypothetical protein